MAGKKTKKARNEEFDSVLNSVLMTPQRRGMVHMGNEPLGPGDGGLPPSMLPSSSQSVRVERKHFTFDLRENPRGKFLRITEEVNGRYDTIIVPLTGVEQFRDALNEIIRASKRKEAATPPPPKIPPLA